jgi:hypothetical protein
MELLSALAPDPGFQTRRGALRFGESVWILLYFKFRGVRDARISGGTAIWTYDFKQGSVRRHDGELSANAWHDQVTIAVMFLESM